MSRWRTIAGHPAIPLGGRQVRPAHHPGSSTGAVAGEIADDAGEALHRRPQPVRGELRRAVARRLLAAGAEADPARIVVTNGAQEALRLGFLVAGRWLPEACALKLSTNVATAVAPQLAVARLLDSGDFERHRQRACPRLGQQVQRMAAAVRAAFPAGTRVSQPAGGFVLWIELPRACDGDRLYADAERNGIGIASGVLFSARGRFRHHLRLNASAWDERIARAVERLGALAAHLARGGR